MKKRVFAFTALLVLVACARNQEVDIPEPDMTLFARTEEPAGSKTIVESGTHVYWEPGDEICVFSGEKSAKFVTDISASAATATFKGTFGEETWAEGMDLWAVYPYSEDAVFDGETITTVLPSEQVARAGSFGKDMNLAIAHSTTSTLQFYNVGGGVRFSVTEEGIKKVMFEGLSGEIISGKVKIGLDENGLPVVQEVSGGSQFITLLPPTGQETFEKDTWYYIVAIPGALEGGYKLRFYKDTDYARKVSEKAVTIKRSIYGNIEKADEGIEYEAQRTHFPETEEEWEKSITLTEEIGDSVAHLKDSLETTSSSELERLEDLIKKIEGVEEVIMNLEENSFSIMQKDSLWINFISVPHSDLDFNALPVFSATNRNSAQRRIGTNYTSQFSSRKRINNSINDDYYVNKKRNALIFCPPFDYSLYFGSNYIVDYLVSAGFQESDIQINNEVSDFNSPHSTDILQLMGSRISGYDFVFIRTHGGIGYHAKKPKGDFVDFTTILFSNTPYNKKTVKHLVDDGELQWTDVAIASLDENNDEKPEYYLCMTPSFLKDTHYDNACIIITACRSARILVNGNNGSMIQTFLDKKAGIVSGYTSNTMNLLDIPLSIGLVQLMSKGLSFQDAILYLQNCEDVIAFSQELKDDYRTNYKEYGYKDKDLLWLMNSVDLRNFHYEPASSPQPYFIIDPYPVLNEVSLKNGECHFSWDNDLAPFTFNWPTFSPGPNLEADPAEICASFTIHYDVYVNEKPLSKEFNPDDTDKTASCTLPPGDYDWYVVANIMEDDIIVASYQSDKGHFTITSGGIDDIPGHDI